MKRREFLKLANTAGAAGLLSGGSLPAAKVSPRVRPYQLSDIKNILVLFVDQQRFDCLGSYGNETVKTPNLDRLARHGVRFTNAYTPAPVYGPTITDFCSTQEKAGIRAAGMTQRLMCAFSARHSKSRAATSGARMLPKTSPSHISRCIGDLTSNLGQIGTVIYRISPELSRATESTGVRAGSMRWI